MGTLTLERDNEGYLKDPGLWSPGLAEMLAAEEDIKLDEERWQVVNFIRDYFETNQAVPEARTLLKHLGQTWGNKQQANRHLYQLFPRGYGQQACKIAGMRKPLKLMLDV